MTARPPNAPPKVDVLSDVLRSIRLTGAAYFDNQMSPPRVAGVPPSCDIAHKVMPGAQRVIEFHFVAQARLAKLVGLSRSAFAERFAEMVGHPPMQYLALWRMQLASRLLREGDTVSTASIAAGYESEAAFSRALKKLVGQSEAAWRSQNESGSMDARR